MCSGQKIFHRGLFDDEDQATTVYCQARLPQISEEASGSEDASDGSSECGSDDVDDDGSGFGSSEGALAKTALTSYSMTSSVLPRNAKLTLLDDMFEKVECCCFCLMCCVTSSFSAHIYVVCDCW